MLPRELLEDTHIMPLVTIVANTIHNQEIGREILKQILKHHRGGKPQIFALRKKENQEWLEKNLDKNQQALWKEESEQTYDVTDELRKTDEAVQREIEKFLSVAQNLLWDA